MKNLNMSVIVLFVTGLLSSQSAFASSATFYYSDGPWSGKVIDVETKAPIEGAVVLAVWRKVYATPAGDNSYFFDAVEVLTDMNGEFLIPKFKAFNILPVLRRVEGPIFTIYKPEYTAFSDSAHSYFNKYFPYSPLRVDRDALAELFKNHVIIELIQIKTNEERLGAQSDALPLGGVPDEKMPALLNVINAERKSLGLDPIHVRGGNKR